MVDDPEAPLLLIPVVAIIVLASRRHFITTTIIIERHVRVSIYTYIYIQVLQNACGCLGMLAFNRPAVQAQVRGHRDMLAVIRGALGRFAGTEGASGLQENGEALLASLA